jgi:hypothetical protein
VITPEVLREAGCGANTGIVRPISDQFAMSALGQTQASTCAFGPESRR